MEGLHEQEIFPGPTSLALSCLGFFSPVQSRYTES